VNWRSFTNRPSALSIAGIVTLGGLFLAPSLLAQGTKPPPINFTLPSDFQIPPSDQKCILSPGKLDLQCILANDPDEIRIRAEEAQLEAAALAAAKSGTLDPYNQVQTLGALEIFDPCASPKLCVFAESTA
jgi:hypothetical protein